MKTNVDLNSKLEPMKKVLIALDYNPSAIKVAESGFILAKSMGAEIILLHVVADYSYYYPTDVMFEFTGFSVANFNQKMDIEGLDKASHYYLEKIKTQLGDASIKIVSKPGIASTTIINEAEKLNVDLIVLGSHSRRWLDKILVGSVAEEILGSSKIPMFIIPIKEHE